MIKKEIHFFNHSLLINVKLKNRTTRGISLKNAILIVNGFILSILFTKRLLITSNLSIDLYYVQIVTNKNQATKKLTIEYIIKNDL